MVLSLHTAARRTVQVATGMVASLVPALCSAGRTLEINIPGMTQLPLVAIAYKVINFLAVSIVAIATVIFLIGALMVVLSRGDDSKISAGKDVMIGSLISLFVVLGSYAILRTFFYVLYYM